MNASKNQALRGLIRGSPENGEWTSIERAVNYHTRATGHIIHTYNDPDSEAAIGILVFKDLDSEAATGVLVLKARCVCGWMAKECVEG